MDQEKEGQAVINIPVMQISEPAEDIRTIITLEGLEELAKSIQDVGVLNPILVAEKNNRYEIMAGHRRYLAAKMAGLVEVPCRVVDGGEEDYDRLKIHENYFREQLSPIDEGKWFFHLREKYGWDVKEIARHCGKSETYVGSRMSLLGADEDVLTALRREKINFSQAREIMFSENENVRKELLRICLDSGATVATLRQMRREYERMWGEEEESLPQGGVGGEPPVSQEYHIQCPCCQVEVNIKNIFPVSVCKKCYNFLVEEFQKDGTT